MKIDHKRKLYKELTKQKVVSSKRLINSYPICQDRGRKRPKLIKLKMQKRKSQQIAVKPRGSLGNSLKTLIQVNWKI
jgi:hypothetical protein